MKAFVLEQHIKKKRDQKNPEHAEKIGNGPEALFFLFIHFL
jgi:hypothetical protein